MPASSVYYEQAARAVLNEIVSSILEHKVEVGAVDSGHEVPDGFTTVRFDKGIQIKPLITVLHLDNRLFSNRCPDPAHDRFAS